MAALEGAPERHLRHQCGLPSLLRVFLAPPTETLKVGGGGRKLPASPPRLHVAEAPGAVGKGSWAPSHRAQPCRASGLSGLLESSPSGDRCQQIWVGGRGNSPEAQGLSG